MVRYATFGSLFDGIGGFPLAAVRADIKPVWASEIQASPFSITKWHFPEMRHLGDIRKINGGEIEPVDIIPIV
jgi:DNA (cytosine-5)-methyltransferase 1